LSVYLKEPLDERLQIVSLNSTRENEAKQRVGKPVRTRSGLTVLDKPMCVRGRSVKPMTRHQFLHRLIQCGARQALFDLADGINSFYWNQHAGWLSGRGCIHGCKPDTVEDHDVTLASSEAVTVNKYTVGN
jgi:hypothetical protein